MRTSLARYAVLALLTVSLSGCYSNGKWSAPDLAFWKKDPPPNSYAPDVNVTPSQVATRQGAPAPGDGYAGLSEMAAPQYNYPETQTGYDPGSYNPGGYDPGSYQYPPNTQAAQDWQNQGGYNQSGQTQGYDPNYGAAVPNPNAGTGDYVAPQQGLYGRNMASGGTSQAVGGQSYPVGGQSYPVGGQSYVGGQVQSGLGAASGTGYGTSGRNDYRSGDLYGNPIRSANQSGMATNQYDNNPVGTSYQDRWDTQRTASRDTSPRPWDTSAGQNGMNSGNAGQYNQYNSGTGYNPATNLGSGVGMSAPAGTGMQGGTTSSYNFDSKSWNMGSAANTQTSTGTVDGYQTGVGSGPQNIPNPYVNSQTSFGQGATDYSTGSQYPAPSQTPGYDYPQSQQPDPNAAGQPQPFRPGSTGASYQSPATDFSGASAAKSFSNYPADSATYPQANTSAGSQLPSSQPVSYQNNTTPIGYQNSTPPIDYAGGGASSYTGAAPNAATGSAAGNYSQPTNYNYQ